MKINFCFILPHGVLVILLSLAGCHPVQPAMVPASDPIASGATDRDQEKLGYTLRNDLLRITIDPTTGDVAYFGDATGEHPFFVASAGKSPIALRVLGHESALTAGYVEARDEQTWQYFGDDSLLRWRKIYSLDHNRLVATFIVQNLTDQPNTIELVLLGKPADDWTRSLANPDLTRLQQDNGSLQFRGFVINPELSHPLAGNQLLRSDSYTLKPQERISFTTEWTYHAMAPVPDVPSSALPASTAPATVPQ